MREAGTRTPHDATRHSQGYARHTRTPHDTARTPHVHWAGSTRGTGRAPGTLGRAPGVRPGPSPGLRNRIAALARGQPAFAVNDLPFHLADLTAAHVRVGQLPAWQVTEARQTALVQGCTTWRPGGEGRSDLDNDLGGPSLSLGYSGIP